MSSSSHGSSARAILHDFLIKSGAALHTAFGIMPAETIHSFVDCSNQVLSYIGLKQSEKLADKGYRRLAGVSLKPGLHDRSQRRPNAGKIMMAVTPPFGC